MTSLQGVKQSVFKHENTLAGLSNCLLFFRQNQSENIKVLLIIRYWKSYLNVCFLVSCTDVAALYPRNELGEYNVIIPDGKLPKTTTIRPKF